MRGIGTQDMTFASRIPELDGVRGLAISLVLVWHYLFGVFAPPDNSVLAALWGLAALSWSGVDLFFVLSGFLIGGILLDHRDSPHYFRTFYIRRACRILPLYFLVVLTFFVSASLPIAKSLPAFLIVRWPCPYSRSRLWATWPPRK